MTQAFPVNPYYLYSSFWQTKETEGVSRPGLHQMVTCASFQTHWWGNTPASHEHCCQPRVRGAGGTHWGQPSSRVRHKVEARWLMKTCTLLLMGINPHSYTSIDKPRTQVVAREWVHRCRVILTLTNTLPMTPSLVFVSCNVDLRMSLHPLWMSLPLSVLGGHTLAPVQCLCWSMMASKSTNPLMTFVAAQANENEHCGCDVMPSGWWMVTCRARVREWWVMQGGRAVCPGHAKLRAGRPDRHKLLPSGVHWILCFCSSVSNTTISNKCLKIHKIPGWN